MASLSESLEHARSLDVVELARSIQQMGFSCTRCGACCRGEEIDEHTATIYPDEIRQMRSANLEWSDIARPIPYGLDAEGHGETFEWALQVADCGDCTFLQTNKDGSTSCGAYTDRPAICRTYPFQIDLAGTTAPQASVVDRDDVVLAYECEGLGEPIDWADARVLATEVKERTIRDIEEARALIERYEPLPAKDGTIVHDSEGPKRVDGTPLEP